MKKVLFALLLVITLIFIGYGDKFFNYKENVMNLKDEIVESKEDNNIKESNIDDEPRVTPKMLPFTFCVENEYDTNWVKATYTNNSEYIITEIFIEYLMENGNKTYLISCDPVLPGETSPNIKTEGEENMEPLVEEYTIYDKDTGLSCIVTVDFKLEEIIWTSWTDLD